MWLRIQRLLQILTLLLLFDEAAYAVNPAQWTIVEELRRTDTTKTWVSPTAVDLEKMVWAYDYEITELTGTVNLGAFGDVTQDITSSIPADQRMRSGETRDLPAALLDDVIVEAESGSSVDVFVEIDEVGFGRAVFSDIMLGSINVPLFGSRPIQRINIEANLQIIGYDFGDYNRDGLVDAADYAAWRKMEGQSGADLAADGDGNGQVDAEDYELWRANFGQGGATPAGGSAIAPEPASFVLAAAAAICVCWRRRI